MKTAHQSARIYPADKSFYELAEPAFADAFTRTDVESVLATQVARMSAFDFTVLDIIVLLALQRRHLSLSQCAAGLAT